MTAGIVLGGGAARRMGGRDKLVLDVGGHRLLDRVLRAARPLCDPLAVVGPARPTSVRAVRFLQEDHPGGGPVPAVFAALAAVGQSEVALVMAGDLPLVTSRSLSRLLYALDSAPQAHAAAALDERGLPNPLLAAYRLDALRRASARGLGPGSPAAHLLPHETLTVAFEDQETLNVNRPADVRRAQALLSAAPLVN